MVNNYIWLFRDLVTCILASLPARYYALVRALKFGLHTEMPCWNVGPIFVALWRRNRIISNHYDIDKYIVN